MIIYRALNYFVQFIQLMILARVIMSWVRINQYSPIYTFIYNVTEPILGPVRNVMNQHLNTGAIDFSPIVAMWLVGIAHGIIIRVLSLIIF